MHFRNPLFQISLYHPYHAAMQQSSLCIRRIFLFLQFYPHYLRLLSYANNHAPNNHSQTIPLFFAIGYILSVHIYSSKLHVTPRPDTMLIGREDAHKSWDSGRPLPKAILNGGLSYRARLVKV